MPAVEKNLFIKVHSLSGIGKSVVCLSPTSSDAAEIGHMLHAARYYPRLLAAVAYGGLRHLADFAHLKRRLPLLGAAPKLCNIHVSCPHLALAPRGRHTNADQAINWLTDGEVGAGVLNRFGAAMISLVLNLFEGDKVSRDVFACDYGKAWGAIWQDFFTTRPK